MKYILPKGFISVDGCSLTVGEVTDTTFSVYLIPETMRCGGRIAWDAPTRSRQLCLPCGALPATHPASPACLPPLPAG